MAHLRTCIPLAASVSAAGAIALASWRLLRQRRRELDFALSDALGAGAVGGLIALVVGVTLCVLKDGSSQPGGGVVGALLGRLLPLAGPALVGGAILGAATAFGLTWALSRVRRDD